MEVMWIVLPMALGIAAIAVLVFIWSVRSGQFDDLVTPSLRILVDDEDVRDPPPPATPCYADGMPRPDPALDMNLGEFFAEAEIAGLRSNLALSPAERFANLVAMNAFHAGVQARTLTPAVRAAIEACDIENARRLAEVFEREHPAQ